LEPSQKKKGKVVKKTLFKDGPADSHVDSHADSHVDSHADSHANCQTLTQLHTLKQEIALIWGASSSHEPSKEILLAKGHAIKQMIHNLSADNTEESSKQSITHVVDTTTNFLRTCLAYTRLKLDHSDSSDLQKPLEAALMACHTSITNCVNNLQKDK